MRTAGRLSWGIAVLLLLAAGCVKSADRLQEISVGMTPGLVEKKLGEPTVLKESFKDAAGKTVEVWEYVLALPSTDSTGQTCGKSCAACVTCGIGLMLFQGGPRKSYWLYFVDGRLDKWKAAGEGEK